MRMKALEEAGNLSLLFILQKLARNKVPCPWYVPKYWLNGGEECDDITGLLSRVGLDCSMFCSVFDLGKKGRL